MTIDLEDLHQPPRALRGASSWDDLPLRSREAKALAARLQLRKQYPSGTWRQAHTALQLECPGCGAKGEDHSAATGFVTIVSEDTITPLRDFTRRYLYVAFPDGPECSGWQGFRWYVGLVPTGLPGHLPAHLALRYTPNLEDTP